MIRRSKVSKHLEQGGSGNIARFSWLVVVMPVKKEKRPDCKKGGVYRLLGRTCGIKETARELTKNRR